MALYEHVFISRQDLSNAQAEGLIEHFSAVLSDNDGKVIDQEYWGLKTMAYKINKNRKGHYAFLKSDAPSSAVQEMERLMRLHDDVMRVMTIRVDEHEEGPSGPKPWQTNHFSVVVSPALSLVKTHQRSITRTRNYCNATSQSAAKSYHHVSPQSLQRNNASLQKQSNALVSWHFCHTQ